MRLASASPFCARPGRASRAIGRHRRDGGLLQSRDTYDQLTTAIVSGGVVQLAPRYNFYDPLISQLVSTIANEMEGSFLNHILVDALNTALAAQIIRLCGDPAAISDYSLEPSNGLSRQRLKRVCDHIETH